MQGVDTLGSHGGEDRVRVEGGVFVHQHRTGANGQRQVDLQAEDIEREGGQRQDPLSHRKPRLAGHARNEVAQGAMGHHYPFGLAG